MRDFTNRTAQLETRRAELIARMRMLDAELDSHGDPDWEENATEHEQDEAMEALGLSAQAELRMIDGALSRMAAGDYGSCVRCGAEISDARLDLLPATPFCRDCAR
ncbi:TraR/DksA family transcriptional regulator [Roseibaca calidilacus]|uniref:Transcriptional regulator, TraR/DksA family n=1 Tax=Roseibaca calidilacus TaxID=1666912 RepID=A0ABM9VR52_9RHOB|nr:TraR/DksA C4-type zinc finger protein [Roseibaca calidilacus]CUX79708.1 transcriptional regulator, TraR/DksA family [Roseibaca calidilacus]